MYEKYYGLKEKPFSLTPDPEFLFVNRHFRGAFDNILYGIKRHEGFTTIIGDVGTGKTTLCRALLGKLDKGIRTALILNPLLTPEDMLKAILQDFGIQPRREAGAEEPADPSLPADPGWMQGRTRKELIDALNLFLLDGARKDTFSILIVDEAQNLSLEVLEQLRILSNLETSKRKLLQIIFVGQLEFEKKLRLPQLRQLNQRITIRYALKPLSKKETIQYIDHRLSVAGSKRSVGFTRGALRAIFSFSKGYPRLINVICDWALLAGHQARTRVITTKLIYKAAFSIRGKERGTRVRFVGSNMVLVPILALLVLALMATVFILARREPLPYLSVNAASRMIRPAPDETKKAPEASPVAAPEKATTSRDAAGTGSRPKPAASPIVRKSQPAPSAGAGSTEGTEEYLLQVHSLATKKEADVAVVRLGKKGYAAFLKMEQTEAGQQWFVVYAGPYDSLQRARDDAATLEQRERLNPIIRRRSAAISG
jgi:general secretion pathway protein A